MYDREFVNRQQLVTATDRLLHKPAQPRRFPHGTQSTPTAPTVVLARGSSDDLLSSSREATIAMLRAAGRSQQLQDLLHAERTRLVTRRRPSRQPAVWMLLGGLLASAAVVIGYVLGSI
jgi:hypothetical protein